MWKIRAATDRFLADESGASMVEYALVVAVIGLAAAVAVTLLGTNMSSRFNQAAVEIGGG